MRFLLLLSLSLGLLAGACGGSGVDDGKGACVTDNTQDWCHDNFDEALCTDSRSDRTWHDGQTCSDLGFTTECPSEWVRPSDSCIT